MPTVIESNAATGLVQVGSNFFLYPVGTSSGPQLGFSGAAVTAGEFGAWTPIGAEQVGPGYQVVWKFGDADKYIVWTTDGSGSFLSQGAVVPGNSLAVELLEAGFQQDLNNDGTTGIVTTMIEPLGSTSLVQVANNYFVGGPSGPQLSAFGAPVVVGEFGALAPIAAEATADGYEVAWKAAGADQYTVLNADSGGVFRSHAFFVVRGNSLALESVEAELPAGPQRRRGDWCSHDGDRGDRARSAWPRSRTLISSVRPGVDRPAAALCNGAAVTLDNSARGRRLAPMQQRRAGIRSLGRMAGCSTSTRCGTPTAAAITCRNGSVLSGTSLALQSFETSFHAGLQRRRNGRSCHDGGRSSRARPPWIGLRTPIFCMLTARSSGPQLKILRRGRHGRYNSARGRRSAPSRRPATIRLPGRTAVPISTSSGTPTSAAISSRRAPWCREPAWAFQSLEHGFPARISTTTARTGAPSAGTVIEANGSTSLDQIAEHLFSGRPATSIGPPVEDLNGAYVTAGEFGAWTPLGAEQTAGGVSGWLEVRDGRSIHRLDHRRRRQFPLAGRRGVGNQLGGAIARDPAFNQDLNNDGRTGPRRHGTTIEVVRIDQPGPDR